MDDASLQMPPSEPQGDPNMDPAGMPPAPQDPGMDSMPKDSGMEDAPAGEGTGDPKKDEVMDILNSVSDKDVETILAYARSRKDASETDAQEGPEGNMPPVDDPDAMPQQPMQESVVFSKKQLRKIHESINSEIAEPEDDGKAGHTTKTPNKKESPFDPPKVVKNLKEEEPKGYGISKHMDQGEEKFMKPQHVNESNELGGYGVPDEENVGGEQKFVGNLEEGLNNDPNNTHWAVNKETKKIVFSWDYNGFDNVMQFKHDYFYSDLEDMELDPKKYYICDSKRLKALGIDPNDDANWALS